MKQPRESGGREEKKKIAIARESERGRRGRSQRGETEAGGKGREREREEDGKGRKGKEKGKKERWRREVDRMEGEGEGVEPGVGWEGRRRMLGGGGVGWRVAKYRSSSLVRNKEQKIDRLLSFMFPGAGGEGGLACPPLLSFLLFSVCVRVRVCVRGSRNKTNRGKLCAVKERRCGQQTRKKT